MLHNRVYVRTIDVMEKVAYVMENSLVICITIYISNL